MIKSIFFRALTLLGLTFVLIGCGAADPGEGGTPGTGAVTQADLEKIEGSIKDMIENAKGSINTSNGHAVAMKIISILKASQPNGSCSFFGVDGLKGTTDGNTGVSRVTTTQYTPYTGTNKEFGASGDGSFEIKAEKEAGVAAAAAAAGVLAKDSILTYTYKKFSIDGKYFLDGTLVTIKQPAVAGSVDAIKDIQLDSKSNTLKLFEGETEIATIEFDKDMKLGVQNTDCLAITLGTELTGANAIMPKGAKVTVKASTGSKFEPVVMESTAIAVTKISRVTGTNLDMLWALLGPKNLINQIIA